MTTEKYINIFDDMDGVKAFFTTKAGAVEGEPGGTVFKNEALFAELGLADTFKVWPRQIHESNIEVIREDDIQKLQASGEEAGVILPATDGIVTDVKNVLLTTVHADCLPVYFYDSKKGVIGLVHAGWRGALAGIAPQAIRKMTFVLGAGLKDIDVHIGPGISKCCFEVGSEVASQFLLEWGFSFAEPIENDDASENAEDKYLLDLKSIVKQQLMNAGIPEEKIEVNDHCTYCEPELFCSYRREGGTYMRMGAGICMI